MTSLTRFIITIVASIALVLTVTAGPEPMPRSYKESKEEVVPPPPPPCDWSGVYVGLHAGGQFGHSEDVDEEGYNLFDRPWGYSESGFVGGGQVGYNFQWGKFVTGPEFDIGYMNLDGTGVEPGSPGSDTIGHSDSDFYTTLRGRIGYSLDWKGCWLLYATGGAIGVNYNARVTDDCFTGNCGPAITDARKQEFDWGYTVGGGVERQIGRHWSFKVEYLYFNLEDKSFSGDATFIPLATTAATTAPRTAAGQPGQLGGKGLNFESRWSGETMGHIVRAGLNFRF